MQAGNYPAHARALLVNGRCPACAEPLGPRSLFGSAPCARCELAVDPTLGGPSLVAKVRERGHRQLFGIALAVGVAHLLLGWMPLIGALVLIVAAAWIRVGILQPTSAMLSPRRRVLTRWTARLVMAAALALTIIATEALTLLPVVGLPIKALLSAGEVAIAAWAVTTYAHWQLRRESEQLPIAIWEWVVLGLCFAALLASVIALALAFAALASAFDSLMGWLQ
ncbi:hypothetical protein ENSA5_24060 [Enhygromyxa salina]|uniref:Uncharacterized protein n=1 Tax=Enhygromyxa salina TaxID=215803 RepID=A0A2S9YB34_9BACT|nr:hypothetical protein [Enhygromyxa salina]PRQ02315.1 hypothetical protein ENSA5_24060 [Enhygromyxa salina]